MKLLEYADAEMMAIDLANVLAGELAGALMHEERATLIVPGGSTPGPIFDALCAADLDWARVDVLLSDERWVPVEDARSNARLIAERLLTGRAAAARFVPYYTGAARPDEDLAEVETLLAPMLPASVALLGMGADMHTASLFPGAIGLAEALDSDAPILVPIHAPGVAEARVTLSARVLREALAVHVVVTGVQKREALERARKLLAEEAPIAAVLDVAVVHWAP